MNGGLEIIEVTGRTLFDSEGNPAVEAEVELENGARGRALTAAPFAGQEFETAFEFLSESVLFEDATDQRNIDKLLFEAGMAWGKGKMDKGCRTAVSMAVSRAAAAGLGMPLYRYLGGSAPQSLPLPMMTMISGGAYGRNNTLDIESLMVVPTGAPSFSEGVRMCTEVYQTLKRLLSIYGLKTGVGDDGGFVPNLKNTEDGLTYIMEAIKLSGYRPGEDMMLAIGAGADQLYDEGSGLYQFKGESRMSGVPVERERNDMIAFYIRLLDGFPIYAVFDGLAEEDAKGRRLLTKMLGNRAVFIGQHLSATDTKTGNWQGRETDAETDPAENAVGISLCSAGSVTEVMEMAEQAKRAGLRIAVSQTKGETEDSFAADFAAAVRADWIRAGAPCRSERTAKYNELLRLDEWLHGCISTDGSSAYPFV